MFINNWFSAAQGEYIAALARRITPLDMTCVEVGCWEGFSTHYIANAIYPQVVHAVDTWRGNTDESLNHPSVIEAKERDVYAQFTTNMQDLTNGNILPYRLDWRIAIGFIPKPLAFLHIDASHDYASVIAMLQSWYPYMTSGGIICGDDYQTASAQRQDLQGGVERAVTEFFAEKKKNVETKYNAWSVVV